MNDIYEWLSDQLVRAEQTPYGRLPGDLIDLPPTHVNSLRRLRKRLVLRAAEHGRRGPPARILDALTRRRMRRWRGWAVVAAAAAAVVVFVVVPAIGGSRTAIAEAAVLKRAAAALDQPNAILSVQVQAYNASGRGISMLGGNEMDGAIMCVPGPCIGPAASTSQTGISADPSNDALTYSSQEWLSPDGKRYHIAFNNGDETASDRTADTYTAYDAADNTLTTLTDMGYTSGPPPEIPSGNPAQAPLLLGLLISNPSDLSVYQQLYNEAQTGAQGTQTLGSVQRTVTAALVGQTTIAGESVYELRFDEQLAITGVCSPNPCHPASYQTLLYLDSQTFLPVRTVLITINPNNNPGLPNGTAVSGVIDYSFTSLPDNSSNEGLLQITTHPGVTQVEATYAQYRAEHRLYPSSGSTSSTGTTGATGASDTTAPSGSTGASGSSSTGNSGTAGTTAGN